jgi:hypothetical protein
VSWTAPPEENRALELDAATARWLVSEAGVAHVTEVTAWLDTDVAELPIATRLRRSGMTATQAAAVVGAAAARRRARERWPDADRLLFTRTGLEQASDPAVSAWRAQRYLDVEVADLCAGIGGDTLALLEAASHVTAVDVDEARLVLLRHNAGVRGSEPSILVGDARRLELPAPVRRHVDPGRRDAAGRRTRRLNELRPPVGELVAAHRDAVGSAIVLPPAVDLNDPHLPAGELEFVQVDGHLVEAVVWLGALARSHAGATATLLPEGLSRTRTTDDPEHVPVRSVGDWVIEVAPAAVRARLHDELARELGAHRLARTRALLTSDRRPAPSPWYSAREVVTVLPARARAVRAWLGRDQSEPVEIVTHGIDVDPARWWRELGKPRRGPKGLRLELVRLDDGACTIVTRTPASDEGGAHPS